MPPPGKGSGSKNPVVNVTQDKTNVKGEFAPLEKDKFSFESVKYPENVGREDVPHYMLFNIYVPNGDKYAIEKQGTTDVASRSQKNMDYLSSQGKRVSNGGATTTGVASVAFIHGAQTALAAEGGLGASAVEGGAATLKGAAGGAAISSFATENVKFRPAVKQIKKAIAIYMPDTVMTSYNHDHSAISATDALGKLGLASALGESIGNSLGEDRLTSLATPEGWKGLYKDVSSSAGGKEVLGTLSEASGLVGPGFTDLALRSGGLAVNPQVELIYKGTANRSFIFEFIFHPRSQKEAATINDIIKTFRMFSSPSINPNSRGRYFIVPAQFDIQFRFKQEENPFIAKISTCVLEAIDVNYSGSGQFASFTDGMPVSIAMQLRFKEADIIYRELVEEFGY